MADNRKYLDLNGFGYAIRKMDSKKADIGSPNFMGTPTINGQQIATLKNINESDLKGEKGDTPVITAETQSLTINGVSGISTTINSDGAEITNFTIMDGNKGERGISVLSVETAPYSNIIQTPDNLVHQMCLPKANILEEAHVEDIYLGDLVMYNGFLYKIGYIGAPQYIGGMTRDVYVDNVGNFKGPQGIQGIQGEQGPQGPKGDPGQGYFIVTDEDYAKIADFIEEKSYHSYQRPNASQPIRPNIFYDFGPQYQLDITFETPQSEYRSNEYMFQFVSPSDRPTTLIMPSTVKWCYDPIIEAGKTYQVSVLNNLAVICGA